MIPKIIHQTAPKDKSKWHFIWEKCHQSWKDKFPEPEYKHIMWTDEDIDDLVSTYYKQYLNLYNSFPLKIIKIDFARFCILDHIGGIYADMDIYCYANFYHFLTNEIYIVEGRKDSAEKLQNSLMCSIPKHRFWQNCFNHTLKFANICNHNEISRSFVLEFCGPIAISKINENISILPKNLFNPSSFTKFKYDTEMQKLASTSIFKNIIENSHDIVTQHFLTGCW